MNGGFEEYFRVRYYSTAIAMLLMGVGAIIYLWVKDDKEWKEKTLERKIEQEVINYFDKDSNGLSYSEDYEIKSAMGIHDSSLIYKPTLKDWEKAYNKIIGDLNKH